MNKSENNGVYKNRKKEMAEEMALNKDQVFPGERAHVSVSREMSEKAILEVVQKGDKEAYGAIVKRYMHSAYYIALGLVHNQQDALDVSQDAFIKAFRNINYNFNLHFKYDSTRFYNTFIFVLFTNF